MEIFTRIFSTFHGAPCSVFLNLQHNCVSLAPLTEQSNVFSTLLDGNLNLKQVKSAINLAFNNCNLFYHVNVHGF